MAQLMPTIAKAGTPKEPPVLLPKSFEQDSIVPFALIRSHTKTDDVKRVPDSLLAFYRNAALQAAEQYTGLLFREQRVIIQDVSDKRDLTRGDRWRDSTTIKLEYPTADGLIYLYGGKHSIQVTTITVPPGTTKVNVPINHYALDMTQCCAVDPCGRPANSGMSIMYRAGMSNESDIPAAIVMGCLKYIAWQINNPGDEALANVNQANVNPQTSRNNAAWQSGAIEEWRLCVRDAY